MAWDIGADQQSTTTQTRQAALDAVVGPVTKTKTAGIDARIIISGPGGGSWDIGADELTGAYALQASLDARIVDLTATQTVTVSAGAAIAPATPWGLTADAAGVTYVALSWNDSSGGTAQHRVYRRKISEQVYTEVALLWYGDTDHTVRYLDPGQTYVFAVAAVSDDGVEGPIITVTQATQGGATLDTSLGALVQDTPTLTCSVGAFIDYTGPTTKRVSGRIV